MPLPLAPSAEPSHDAAGWRDCRFLTCSVLPVRVACNLSCPFCFSKSSVSALRHDRADWRSMDVAGYYRFARDCGATRLVVTGGGEPLLRPDDVAYLVSLGRRFFDEITLFTNGALLTRPLARRLQDAGLSYVCYSRHGEDDAACRELMGPAAPRLADFMEAAGGLTVRATCVMAKGYVDSRRAVWRYVRALAPFGVRQFTFKHTYVAYEGSVFQGSAENAWAADRQVEFDPFAGQGQVVARLPWGPCVRRVRDESAQSDQEYSDQEYQVCYYHEPTPRWELENRVCRSSNLLSDGRVYASLEDRSSLLYRLGSS